MLCICGYANFTVDSVINTRCLLMHSIKFCASVSIDSEEIFSVLYLSEIYYNLQPLLFAACKCVVVNNY